MTKKQDVLQIRCSDGRSRKSHEIRSNWVHEIRHPGGILFPDLCALANPGSEQTAEMSLLFAIDTMVQLKKPSEIICVFHTHCGAADAIGLTAQEIHAKHILWQDKLAKRYPDIKVRILHEAHSECGEYHHGHTEVTVLDSSFVA